MGKKSAPKMGNRPAQKSGPSKPRAPPKQPANKPAGKQAPDEADEAAQPAADRQSPKQDAAQQQKLLGIFQDALSSVLSSGTFNATLQEVKTALYNRDFDTAFGREDYLEAYAARWSPTRALCYDAVLRGIAPHLEELLLSARSAPPEHVDDDKQPPLDDDEPPSPVEGVCNLRVLAIGGAAAEVVALGSHLSRQPASTHASVTLVDMAPWSQVVDKLRVGLATPPALSAYASAAARARLRALVEADRLRDVSFVRSDVLALDRDGLAALVGAGAGDGGGGRPVLVTLLFTLNELFTGGGVGKTTAFLLGLTSVLPRGSLLLIVDSPGSYSEATVGKEAKRYPMQWLLDRILLRAEVGEDEGPSWVKVEEKDSVWFRLSPGLRYPIPLEDMRYQMHLYRRGSDDVSGGGNSSSGEDDGEE